MKMETRGGSAKRHPRPRVGKNPVTPKMIRGRHVKICRTPNRRMKVKKMYDIDPQSTDMGITLPQEKKEECTGDCFNCDYIYDYETCGIS